MVLIFTDLMTIDFSIYMHIVTQKSQPSALKIYCFPPILNKPIWMRSCLRKSCMKQYEKKKRGFPLRRREQGSHSEYDNHVLNYVKSRCSPPSAGMSPLAQRNFIALPSFCCGDTGGQKPALTPWGHLLGSPPRHTL